MEVVLTAYRYGERELLRGLRGLGIFYKTGFKDVIRGRVEDLEIFLQRLEERKISTLSRVIPIEKSFTFSHETAVEDFCNALRPLLKEIQKGESFGAMVKRRGLKGAFSSQEVAKEVGTFISKVLEERDGEKPKVKLRTPDKLVVIETLEKWGGVGILSKDMSKRCFYPKPPYEQATDPSSVFSIR